MGNADTVLGQIRALTVHPHGCGERSCSTTVDYSSRGSSPRLWGTLTVACLPGRLARFIPTAVGNAGRCGYQRHRHTVHPHGCGERRGYAIFRGDTLGSSPRLWGTRRLSCSSLIVGRFIPTAVGNASNFPPFSRSTSGSSPRLWGTPRG